MPVWRRFTTSSSSVKCLPTVSLVSKVNPGLVLLSCLGYVSAVPQVLSSELLSCPILIPFTRAERLFTSSLAQLLQAALLPLSTKPSALLWIQSSRNYSRAMPGISSSPEGAEHTALGRVRPLKSVDFPVLPKNRQTSAWHMLILPTFLSLKVLQLNDTLFSCTSCCVVKCLKTHDTGWCFEGNFETFKLPSCCKCYQT